MLSRNMFNRFWGCRVSVLSFLQIQAGFWVQMCVLSCLHMSIWFLGYPVCVGAIPSTWISFLGHPGCLRRVCPWRLVWVAWTPSLYINDVPHSCKRVPACAMLHSHRFLWIPSVWCFLNMFIGFLLHPVSIVLFRNISTGFLGYKVCVRSPPTMLNEFLG